MTEGQEKPKRIQRRRVKGWKMPPNTVYVGRPTKWGNPFTAEEYGAKLAVFNFRQRMKNFVLIGEDLSELRGKNLACWCKEGDPCHADVLLEIANREEVSNG